MDSNFDRYPIDSEIRAILMSESKGINMPVMLVTPRALHRVRELFKKNDSPLWENDQFENYDHLSWAGIMLVAVPESPYSPWEFVINGFKGEGDG